jgi:hypothetical protein
MGESMFEITNRILKIFKAGGWAPLLVFVIHVFIANVLRAYDRWPWIDVPMHFFGGMAIAFFVSKCFQTLPRQDVPRNRLIVLELLLAGSLTATAAVFWEFEEFTFDQLFHHNVQISLANTMKDLAMGVTGSIAYIAYRATQLRAGVNEVRELALDWFRGQAA